MLTIRLRRHGARRDPHYRVVVTERSAKRDGPFIEILGHYHPRKRPAEIVFDMERVETWLGKGAIMSDTVRTLYQRVRSGKVETVEPETKAGPEPTAAPGEETAEEAAAAPTTEEETGEREAKAAAAAEAPEQVSGEDASEASEESEEGDAASDEEE